MLSMANVSRNTTKKRWETMGNESIKKPCYLSIQSFILKKVFTEKEEALIHGK